MNTQWGPWLAEMKAAQMGGSDLVLTPITRGMAYLHVMAVEADVSMDAFAANLRLSPDAAAPLQAEFDIDVGDYADGVTVLTLTLSEADVEAITATDGDLDGLEELVFYLFHTPDGGDQYRVAGTTITIAE
jgi:hypothetical protein